MSQHDSKKPHMIRAIESEKIAGEFLQSLLEPVEEEEEEYYLPGSLNFTLKTPADAVLGTCTVAGRRESGTTRDSGKLPKLHPSLRDVEPSCERFNQTLQSSQHRKVTTISAGTCNHKIACLLRRDHLQFEQDVGQGQRKRKKVKLPKTQTLDAKIHDTPL